MRIVPIIIAVIVAAFMYFFIIERDSLLAFAASEDPAAEELVADAAETPDEIAKNVVRVVAVRSEAQLIDSAIVVRGETEAERQIDVLAETSGLITSQPLRAGAFVEKDQIICEIDPGTRHAMLAEAKARLMEAKINGNAASKLSEGGFASESRVASAQAAVQAAEAQVASAQKEIDRLTVRAPFAGLLETDAAEFGSLLSAQGPNGAHCATIIQLDPIKLVGFVPETEVNRVELGALGGGRLASGEQVQGKVTFISRAADPNTRTFRVELEVANEDLRIRDGQTAEIIIASEGKAAHLLPQSALTLNDEGVLGVRVVAKDNKAGFVPVAVLRDTTDGIWLDGLPQEVDVIIVGQEYVIAGVPVEASYQETNE